jgi:hypothetical protein
MNIEQARKLSRSCGAKCIIGGHTKRGTDRQTSDTHTHRVVYRVAP